MRSVRTLRGGSAPNRARRESPTRPFFWDEKKTLRYLAPDTILLYLECEDTSIGFNRLHDLIFSSKICWKQLYLTNSTSIPSLSFYKLHQTFFSIFGDRRFIIFFFRIWKILGRFRKILFWVEVFSAEILGTILVMNFFVLVFYDFMKRIFNEDICWRKCYMRKNYIFWKFFWRFLERINPEIFWKLLMIYYYFFEFEILLEEKFWWRFFWEMVLVWILGLILLLNFRFSILKFYGGNFWGKYCFGGNEGGEKIYIYFFPTFMNFLEVLDIFVEI